MKPHRMLLHGQQQPKQAAVRTRAAALPPLLGENSSYCKQ